MSVKKMTLSETNRGQHLWAREKAFFSSLWSIVDLIHDGLLNNSFFLMHGSTFKIRTFGDSLFTVADYSNYVARSLNLYAFVDFLPKYLLLSWLSKHFFFLSLCRVPCQISAHKFTCAYKTLLNHIWNILNSGTSSIVKLSIVPPDLKLSLHPSSSAVEWMMNEKGNR